MVSGYIYIEKTHHVGCDACGGVPDPPYLVIVGDEDTALSACMFCVKRVLAEYDGSEKSPEGEGSLK